ncbi:MarR family transcriptional regulator [Desulforamulus ferrireducens]|uniref:MarR family transcriptional regulator n=1 Tax=Desulforamulus ferrireducens TaxID=1833852 RepID=A0A1S6IYZ2_9FIRM|nr:MarR family transcriptional regulator [Desulforamulus ferrireducens]
MLKAIGLANLDEIERNVFIFVREHVSPDGMLIYPLREMGKNLGYSELEIQRALRNLENLQLVDYREGDDPNDPNMILYKDEWLDMFTQQHTKS